VARLTTIVGFDLNLLPSDRDGLLDKPLEVDIQQIEIKLDESDSGAQPNRAAPAEDPADYFKRK